MKKISITNNKGIEYSALFETQEELDAWKAKHVEKDTWGKAQREVVETDMSPVSQEDKDSSLSSELDVVIIPASSQVITDLSGEEVTISIPETRGNKYVLPAEYTISEEDFVEDYKEMRLQEYLKIQNLLAEALVEKELGDSTKFDEYIVLRNAIKAQYPKP